jgi:hypothetical protein
MLILPTFIVISVLHPLTALHAPFKWVASLIFLKGGHLLFN